MNPIRSADTAAALHTALTHATDGVLLYRVGLRIYEAKADLIEQDFASLREAYAAAVRRLCGGKEART